MESHETLSGVQEIKETLQSILAALQTSLSVLKEMQEERKGKEVFVDNGYIGTQPAKQYKVKQSKEIKETN